MHGLAFNISNMRVDRQSALRAMTVIGEGDMPSDVGRVRSWQRRPGVGERPRCSMAIST